MKKADRIDLTESLMQSVERLRSRTERKHGDSADVMNVVLGVLLLQAATVAYDMQTTRSNFMLRAGQLFDDAERQAHPEPEH